MHQTVLNNLPEKSLKELLKTFWRIFWYNFLYPKLNRVQKKNNPSIKPEVQRLHLESHRLKGELSVLESELQALPFIDGTIREQYKKSTKDPNKIHVYYTVRWTEDGRRKEKHLAKIKKKDGDLTVEEARVLIANTRRAKLIQKQIKDRQNEIGIIEDRLTILTGRPIDLSAPITKEALSTELIGRNKEFAVLENNLLHSISTLIIGEPGIGKSFLLKNLLESQNRHIIWIENLKAARIVLIDQVIVQLHQNNKLRLDEENYSQSLSPEELKSKCLKNKSITQLADIIRDSLIGQNYVVAIDSMAGLTQANQVIIDKLIETNTPIFACTNQLKRSIELESIYRKFSRLELEPLPSSFIRSLLKPKIDSLMAGEYEKGLLETKIVNVACGNPGVAEKMFKDAQALSMSGSLSVDRVYSIQEPELPRRYFDLTPIVIMSIAGFAVLRFIGIGTNDTVLYIAGGIAFVVLMAFGRVMMRAWRG